MKKKKPLAYKIDQGIPIPERGRPGMIRWPFREMEVGESFYVGDYSRDSMRYVCNAGRNYFRKMNPGLTVCARRESTGFRVWVIKKGDAS